MGAGGCRGLGTASGKGCPRGLSGQGPAPKKSAKRSHTGVSNGHCVRWSVFVVIREGDRKAFVRPSTGSGRKLWWQNFCLPRGTDRSSHAALPERTWAAAEVVSQERALVHPGLHQAAAPAG